MTFQVRLYLHHDNDLIQLHLNGIRLCDMFAKSLEAHYKKEALRFEIPKKLELKPNKGKVYRIKVTLDEKKQPDLVRWVRAFPDQYKCHCIKNIARTYLGSSVIDALNGMAQDGTWVPDSSKNTADNNGKTVRLREWKRKEDRQEPTQWIDQVSATREKTEEQKRKIEEAREKIRSQPIEEILGARPADLPDIQEEDRSYHTTAGTAMAAGTARSADTDEEKPKQEPHHGSDGGSFPDAGFLDTLQGMNGHGGDITEFPDGPDSAETPGNQEVDGDFDVSLLFEQLRSQ